MTPAQTLKKEKAKLDRMRWEAHLARDLKAYGIDGWQREYLFHPTRKWRMDFYFPIQKLAVEVDGIVWNGHGGHQSGVGYENDREKDQEALLMGIRVYRVTPKMIKSGQAVRVIERLLKMT